MCGAPDFLIRQRKSPVTLFVLPIFLKSFGDIGFYSGVFGLG